MYSKIVKGSKNTKIFWIQGCTIQDLIQFFMYFAAKQIVVLQEDGKFSTSSYMKHKSGIGNQPLDDFTFCIRFQQNWTLYLIV